MKNVENHWPRLSGVNQPSDTVSHVCR